MEKSMTKDELISRLKGYEWTEFECKRAQRDVPKDVYSTVSAFANTQGGWLLFGVTEKNGLLEASGVDPDAFDRVQNAFLTTLRAGQKLNQIVNATPYAYDIDGKRILAFYIPELERHRKPVYLNGNPWDSYIRRAARDERVTDSELHRFLRDSSRSAWDSEGVADIEVESCIDTETLRWYQELFYRRNPEQRQVDDSLEFLQEWNFLIQQNGKRVLTRAAVLLFGHDRYVRGLLPRPVLDYQRIDTRFDAWSADERWHDRVIFEENLFKTWRGLVAKYSRIAEHPFKVDPATMRRNDDPPDYIAFREATINMLIHQDYGDHNRKASLKWFTDRLIFWNPGDAFATKAQLLESNEKDIRNPLIVNAFRRIGLSDQAGTGIRSILRNWRELGRRPPLINNDKAGKAFELILLQAPLMSEAIQRFLKGLDINLTAEQATLLAIASIQPVLDVTDAAMALNGNLALAHHALEYLCNQQLFIAKENSTYSLTELTRSRFDQAEKAESMDKHVTGQVTGQVTEDTGQVENWLFDVLTVCIDPKKSTEIQEIIGIKHRETFQRNYLDVLLEQGLLVRTILDKPQSRLQRYKTTEQGQTLLKQNRQ